MSWATNLNCVSHYKFKLRVTRNDKTLSLQETLTIDHTLAFFSCYMDWDSSTLYNTSNL